MIKDATRNKSLIVPGIIGALILALLITGCGSGSSEEIVGKWNLIAVQTDGSAGWVQRSGSATAGADGTISIDVEGKIKISGTWEAIPKNQWPDSFINEYVGIYKLSLKMEDTNSSRWSGSIFRTNTGYAFNIFADGNTDLSLYFAR